MTNPGIEQTWLIAKLHPGKIERYEHIHARQSEAEKEVTRRRGHLRITIWRAGLDLVLHGERDPVAGLPLSLEEEALQAAWHASLAECFAEPWRPLVPIYEFRA